jgi:hypothetical protein
LYDTQSSALASASLRTGAGSVAAGASIGEAAPERARAGSVIRGAAAAPIVITGLALADVACMVGGAAAAPIVITGLAAAESELRGEASGEATDTTAMAGLPVAEALAEIACAASGVATEMTATAGPSVAEATAVAAACAEEREG